MEQPSGVGAIVLAGGRSTRLGHDKALLRINGQPLVEWLPARLSCLLSPVVIVVDGPGRYQTSLPQVPDVLPGTGPLGGVASGLQALAASAALVCACDMPLLQPDLIALLCASLSGFDLVIPERDGRLEPLCAVYTRACLPAMQALLANRQLRLNGMASAVRARIVTEGEWREVDPRGDSFLGINTLDELATMRKRARGYGLELEAP